MLPKRWRKSPRKLPEERKQRKLRTLVISSLLFCGIALSIVCILLVWQWITGRSGTLMNPLSKQSTQSTEALLAQELTHQGIAYTSLSVLSDGSYQVQLPTKSIIIFSEKKDIIQDVSSLQRIVNRFTIDDRKAYQIDFRYDTPTIRFIPL